MQLKYRSTDILSGQHIIEDDGYDNDDSDLESNDSEPSGFATERSDSAKHVEGHSGDVPAEVSTDIGNETVSTISTFSDVTVSQTSLMFVLWLHVIIDTVQTSSVAREPVPNVQFGALKTCVASFFGISRDDELGLQLGSSHLLLLRARYRVGAHPVTGGE